MKNNFLVSKDINKLKKSYFNITDPKLIHTYLEELDVKPSSKKEYKTVLECFSQYLKKKHILQPKKKDLIAYKEELLKKGCTPRTIRLYFSVFRGYFNWLEKGLIYPNITYNLKSPRITKEMKRQALTSDQVADILNSINQTNLKGKQIYALILLASTTGLRAAELSSLNINDWINLQDKTFLTVIRKGYQEKQLVAIGPEADAAIRNCLKDRGIYNPSEPLFISTSNRNRGEAITPKSIGRIFKTILKDNGFNSTYFTGHSFRHTAATLGMNICDNDIFTVKKFMGHSNIETTVLYVDHNELLGQDIAAQIEKKLLDNKN